MKYKRILKYFIDAHAANNPANVAMLLQSGLDLSKLDKYGTSFLILSCTLGAHSDITWFLLQHGAAINLQSPKNGYSALHYCVEIGRHDLVELLLSMPDIEINIKDHCGFTCLMLACRYDNVTAVALLLRHGADVNARSNHGNSALLWSVHNGNVSLTKMLLDNHANIKTTDNFGNNAFIKSCRYGNRAICELLLQYDPDILDSTNDLQVSGIVSAISNQHYSLFLFLLEQKADLSYLQGSHVMQRVLLDIFEHPSFIDICIKLISRFPAYTNFSTTTHQLTRRSHIYFDHVRFKDEAYTKNHFLWFSRATSIHDDWVRVYGDLHAVYMKAKHWDAKRGFLMFVVCYGFIPLSTTPQNTPTHNSYDSNLKGKVFGNENLVRIIARYL